MKIEKPFCFEIIKKDINDINKKLSVLEQVLYNIDLFDSNVSTEFLVDTVSETIEEVKSNVEGISSVINLMIETDLKF